MASSWKVWVPDMKFAVGVLITLAVTVLVLKQFSTSPTMGKVRTYLGLAV